MFCSVNYNFTGKRYAFAITSSPVCGVSSRQLPLRGNILAEMSQRDRPFGSTASSAMCFHFDIYAPHSDSDVSRNVRKDIFPIAVPLCNCLFHVWLISVGSGEPCQVICNSCSCQYFVLNKKLQYASSYMFRIVVVCVNGIAVTSHD